MNDIVLKLNNVSKSFPKVETNSITNAISDINLEIKSPEFVSIVGPSGCGKSTILRLISGLIFPTTGNITINNEKIEGPNEKIAMVFQKPTLFPWLTVWDNIAFGLKIRKKVDKKLLSERVNSMIDIIGLSEFANDYPGQLSGGMAQRAAIARAIINEPEILLLDEPLGALDAFTRMHMQDEILSIWKKKQQLVIMVTHDIEEAVYMSTKVIVVDKNPGRVKQIVNINLSENRDRSSDEFVKYRNDILKLLKENL